MPSPAVPRRPSSLPRLIGDARGATAVEFGLVAVPFIALLGAILQVAFTTWAQQNLEFVFQRATRSVFTGKFQMNNDQTATDAKLLTALQNSMCGTGTSSTPVVFNCAAVKLDISIGTNFATSAPVYPVNAATKDWNANFGTNYTCAAPGSIVIATAAVKSPIFLSLLAPGFANFADGSRLLMATAVFRTEPYALAGKSPC